MPWWLITLLIVAGCACIAIIMLMPLAFAWGATIGLAASKRPDKATGDT